ncbi:chaperone protein DNAJ, putative [Entamoeba invadens IP1]|uniref:Chaperone protein DNAJ, putative n=2 Tax=Entamoeba invadens TaxID=33085 RepID=A0A0A1U5M8_ENTIV|nr:chaperone protein DNAJ, putative [Entamoeba invadens IP1]ELP89560.1 chaperone protein DNAJ, putative [Entamoeba invadens IP1]BAN40239.1 chaperone protein DNAJ, putative [Entamoeba invadens]|eukprot:XP_004256331.1 chaperone protein DNAJ, putative [Entamoeba invadens IP1]
MVDSGRRPQHISSNGDVYTAFLIVPFLILIIGVVIMLVTHSSFFQNFFSTSRPTSKLRLEVSLQDAYAGRTITQMITRNINCPKCGGTGAHSSHDIHTCSRCGGQGKVRQQVNVGLFIYEDIVMCPRCKGSGVEVTKYCDKCRGSGKVSESIKVSIEIPPYTRNGDVLTIKGKGEMESDLLVYLSVPKEGKGFRVNGDDFDYDLNISLKEALLGFERRIEHLDGHQILIKRSGVTEDGSVIPVSREGLKNGFFSKGYCNFHIKVDVNSISQEQARKVAKILKEK